MSSNSTSPGRGHNGGVDAAELIDFVERWEAANARIKDEQEIRKEVKAEAKSRGYTVKTIGAIVALRAMDPSERHDAEDMLELYKSAVGLD